LDFVIVCLYTSDSVLHVPVLTGNHSENQIDRKLVGPLNVLLLLLP